MGDNNYEISLGIDLDTSGLKEQINKLDKKYDVKLGVNVGVDDIRKRISEYNKNSNNAKLHLKVKLDTDDLKKQINSLNLSSKNNKGVTIPVNTESLETSLKEVKGIIADIKNSIGTLDSGAGMKSLLSSINQISSALDKASGKFEELVADLKVLSAKDFNINLGINASGSNNPIARNSAYGNKVRNETLPQLKQQAEALENYLKEYYKVADGFNAAQKLLQGTGAGNGKASLYDLLPKMLDSSNSLSTQMSVWKEYIALIKEAASIKGIDLSGVTSQFSKQSEELVKDAQDIQTGAKETKDGFEQLKQVLGSGLSFEGLSDALDPIIQDLKAIRESIDGLSKGISIEGLTSSFDRLSESIELLVKNCTTAKQAINNTVGGLGGSTGSSDNSAKNLNNDLKQVTVAAENTADAIQEVANEARKLDNISIDISNGNIDDIKNALRNMNVDDADIEEATKELNELNIVAKNVSATFKNGQLIKIDVKGVETAVDGLERAIAATTTFGEKGVTSSTKYGQAFDKIANSAQKIQNKLRDIGFDGFDAEVQRTKTAVESLNSSYDDLNASLKQLDVAMDAVNSADQASDINRLVAANEEYEESLKQVISLLKKYQQEEKNAFNVERLEQTKASLSSDMEIWLRENTRAAKEFGEEVRVLQSSLNGLDANGIKIAKQQFDNIKKTTKALGKDGLTTFDKLKAKAKEYMTYLSAAELFMYAEQALRSMFEQVKLIDSAMTELKKVTDETDESYNKFLTNAATRAKEIGTTIDGLVSSTADFARLGYGFEDSQGLAEVANIYAVVGDEIEGVEGATQSLISTLTAFKDEAVGLSDSDFAMSIIDKMNEVSNNFAISSGGIGEALQRSASSMQAANNSLDETIALITAANTVVQDPEVVGTAFKTISMRIRGAKTELEEAGLETEGMASSTAKLREEILALSGVDIMLNANEFKSTYQIMDELADKWQDLTDIQQASVTELIAGKRQGNIISSLMNNFNIAEQALETSLSSAGSAMEEHEKWQQSLEAQILKLQASWQGLSQAFLSSDFLKIALDGIIGLVDGTAKLIDKIGTIPTILTAFSGFKVIKTIISTLGKGDGLKEFSGILGLFQKSFPNATESVKKLVKSLREVSLASGGAGTAFHGFLSLILQHPYIAAATVAVTALTAAFAYQKKKAEELSQEVGELTSKYKQQYKELKDLKGDYDTSNESSMISKYEKLSKGVDNLGRNVSLTADEYSEYQSIVGTIADQIPSLVSGYDEQGNALLSCKGNVEELTKAYEKLIHAQNQEILTNTKDIEKNFENISKDKGDISFWEKLGHNTPILEWFLEPEDLPTDVVKKLENALNNHDTINGNFIDAGWDKWDRDSLEKALEDSGIDVKWYQDSLSVLKDTLESDPSKIKGIIDDHYAQFAEIVEQRKFAAQAVLSEAFDVSSVISGLDYGNIGEDLQVIASQTINSLNYDFFTKLDEQGKTVEQWTKEMLGQLNAISKEDSDEIEAAFNLQTKFNGGEISYGEYVKGLEDTGELIGSLNLKPELESQLKLSLGLDEDGLVEDYKSLNNRLMEITAKDLKDLGHFSGMKEAMEVASEKVKEFVDSLSAEELSVATDIIPKIDAGTTIEDIRAAIDRELAVQGLLFELNLEVETAGIESLNEALAESVSASGLSSESISALKNRYADLESEGYNISAMFEETSNGIHLNKKALSELEQAYINQKKVDIDEDLKELQTQYELVTKDIENCNDASERAALYVQRDSIIQQINDAATLASQYEGLTSAYNAWLSAEEAGSERDMYESIIEGFETVSDEISRGWIDDSTIKFLELLTGRTDLASKSGRELKEIYDGLDNVIGNSGYSISDFFTVNDDGESTNTGVYNFLETVESFEDKLGDVIQRKDGNIIGFDFKVAGGDKAIAETLEISEELVQIMIRAADDAGFVVNIDGAYTQLADLKTEAETARDALISLKNNGLEKLKDTDVNFNLGAEGSELVEEQKRAVELLNKFKNGNGVIDLSIAGAQEALDIAEYLTIKIDDLTEPKYMKIDVSTVEEDLQEPIKKMQEFERLSKEKHLLTLTGDAAALAETEVQMDNIAQYLDDIDDKEVQAKLGITGLTKEEIADKLEKGEIELDAELNLDVQMSDDLRDIRLLMMGQLGITDKNEVELKVVYDIDDSLVDELKPEQQEVVLKYVAANEAEFNKYTEKEKETVVKLIADGVELEKYKPEDKEAIVNYIANGEESDGWTPEAKEAFVKYLVDGGEPDKFDPQNKDSWVVYGVDDSKPKSYEADDKPATVNYGVNDTEVKQFDPPNIFRTVYYTIKETIEKIASGGKSKAAQRTGANPDGKGSNVNGTANVNGTTGHAFKQGDWGTKSSGVALGGELGQETIVRDGRFFTIGDHGAEFFHYKKGDIIFNHKQTEELFANGKVTSGGGRGKAFADGNAFSIGSGGIGKITAYTDTATSNNPNNKISTKNAANVKKTDNKTTVTTTTEITTGGSSGNGDSIKVDANNAKEQFDTEVSKTKTEEVFDWIEVLIDRIERSIDRLDKKANNSFKNWSIRNSALVSEIGEVGREISAQQSAYNRYMQQANSVGLDSSWAAKVRNGAFDISTVTNEDLADKISKYKEYYEKALDCQDAIDDLREKESALYKQRFDNVAAEYEGVLSIVEHEKNMLEEYISQSEAQSWLVSSKYYDALANNEQENISKLKEEKNALVSSFNSAMNSGTIDKYSEAWYEMVNAIDEVTLAITEGETALLEYQQTLQQLNWEVFDILQERISNVTEEADFLIELISSDKLYEDNGQLTDNGKATMGLHGQNYNVYMHQADKYRKEVEELNKELEKDPYDQDLISRRDELLELQRNSILAAEDEKNAIRDMVEEGIEYELDALQELIDKKNEELDSVKDLYDYNKKVKEQTKEIASLEKQMVSFSGDDSEEAKAKIQELKVSLEEARSDLEETEYDKYISDTQKILDDLYLEYETILNERLDNLDGLISDMILEINSNAGIITDTINTSADSVGYTLTTEMQTIWSGANNVITTYGEKFSQAQTTTNTALNTINTNLQNMIAQLNSIANAKVQSASSSSASHSSQSDSSHSSPPASSSSSAPNQMDYTGVALSIINGNHGWGTGEERAQKLAEAGFNASEVQNLVNELWNDNSVHSGGWENKYGVGDLSQYNYNNYKTGISNIEKDQLAWTQEGRKREFIVRPSDGAILTPLAKNDSVLNSAASDNIWKMANSPTEFIRDNLNLGVANVPNNSNVNNNITQNLDNVVFSFPNVHSYNEMLTQMQKDKNFEKLILSMSIDRVAGGSSLAKGKSIR